MADKEWSRDDKVGFCACATVFLVVIITLAIALPLTLVNGGCGINDINCSSGSTTVIVLPYVTPPVAAAAPTVFVISITTQKSRFATLSKKFRAQSTSLNPQTVIDRFFNPDGGPSNLFGILKQIDARVQGINGRLGSQFAACMATAPTKFTLSTWGLNTTFYAQCSETWQGPQGQTTTTGFDQWAVKGSDFYLFEGGGETHVAAILHNYNATGGPDLVNVWYSVGCINRNGSHGTVQIKAQPKLGIFEMTAAGGGLGFCGAQLKSDNTTLNITGSEDMGATCSDIESICVSAQSLSQTTNCTAEVNTFELRPIGRMPYNVTTGFNCDVHPCLQGPSKYPSVPNVYLTGTGIDSTFFGPSTPVV